MSSNFDSDRGCHFDLDVVRKFIGKRFFDFYSAQAGDPPDFLAIELYFKYPREIEHLDTMSQIMTNGLLLSFAYGIVKKNLVYA